LDKTTYCPVKLPALVSYHAWHSDWTLRGSRPCHEHFWLSVNCTAHSTGGDAGGDGGGISNVVEEGVAAAAPPLAGAAEELARSVPALQSCALHASTAAP
jgi:hypothetical protein